MAQPATRLTAEIREYVSRLLQTGSKYVRPLGRYKKIHLAP